MPKHGDNPIRSIRLTAAAILVLAWTMVVAGSLTWSLHEQHFATEEAARTEARTVFEKDLTYHWWSASRGGVYVKLQEGAEPSSYLNMLERDVPLPSGGVLTYINPAHMTRQVFDLMKEEKGVRGHITSLKPLRPENRADAWEQAALASFERGVPEVSAIAPMDTVPYMRLMRPLLIDASCLKCHVDQGYKAGDIGGGISVAVPMGPLWAIMAGRIRTLWIGHALLWALGVLGIVVAAALVTRQAGYRVAAENLAEVRTMILEKVANPVLITDRNGIIEYVNPAFTELTGYALNEIKGKTPRILKSGRQDGFFYHKLWEWIQRGAVWQGEVTDRKKDGSLYVAEETITPVRGRNNEIESYFALQTDITKRKEAEYGMIAHAEGLTLPLEVERLIQRARSIDEILDGVLSALLSLHECGDSGKAVAFLADHQANVLRLVKTRGHFSEEFLEAEAVVPFGTCLCGRAAVEGKVLVCENCFEDPRHENRWIGMKAHGHYSVALTSGLCVVGVITLYTATGAHSDPARIALLQGIGAAVGLAIDRLQADQPTNHVVH